MGLKEDLDKDIKNIFSSAWTTSDGKVIPSDQSVTLGNSGTRINATVLYADLAGSTKLVQTTKDETAAEIYKSFLKVATKIILSRGGEIAAFDGDRVMAVYMGTGKNTAAVKTALNIKFAINEIVKPAFEAQYSYEHDFEFGIGIHCSQILVCKTGVRNNNDLLWMGNASNLAAKLCSIRGQKSINISESVYDNMNSIAKYVDPKTQTGLMWTKSYNNDLDMQVYGSNYYWGDL